MQKRWVPVNQPQALTVQKLAESLQIDPALAQILVQRGIPDFDAAKRFFRPELSSLHDPFMMQDMDKAVLRIEQALAKQEKILIYGDYDVDGTTAVTLVYSFLNQLSSNIEYYIPDRYKEGYGISIHGIDYAAENGFGLIIALDCGIKAIEQVAYAHTLGLDFIICDHHMVAAQLPAAVAVLDPKRPDCPYPFKELAGCGIGFKLIEAYAHKNHMPEDSYLQYLDLVMVSIAADIVPIVGENRILAYHGLKKLNNNPCRGLKALMEVSGRTHSYNISDVVFSISPRINAAGRIDHAKKAVEMLLCQESALADTQSLWINTKNTERKSFDQSITLEALAQIEQDAELISRKTTVVYNENWHKGVIGIVASRLTEKYYRPTIVLTKSNDLIAGSARSVAGFDLYEALSGCADLLEQFGGHKFAAGLTMQEKNVKALMQKFEEIVSASISEDLLTPELLIDAEIALTHIDGKFFRIVQQMGPFGPENMAPLFVSHGVELAQMPGLVGANHLKMQVKQQNSSNFDTIAFNLGEYAHQLKMGTPFSIVYSIEENNWKDTKRIQLNIKDIRLS